MPGGRVCFPGGNKSETAGRGFMVKMHRVLAPGLNLQRLFFRHELGVDELKEFGDAELVHTGAVVVGLDLEGFVQAFGNSNGDYPRRFFFGIDVEGPFCPQLGQHVLDLTIGIALLKIIEQFPGRECMPHDAMQPKDFSVEGNPIRAFGVQVLGDLLNFTVFVRQVECYFRTHCFLLVIRRYNQKQAPPSWQQSA
jgi:hypothetical protein